MFTFNVIVNTAPIFVSAPVLQTLVAGFTTSYALPASVDNEGDAITIAVDTSLVATFATYSSGVFTFSPPVGLAGPYSIPITLSDNYPSSTPYVLSISVIPDIPPTTSGAFPSVI